MTLALWSQENNALQYIEGPGPEHGQQPACAPERPAAPGRDRLLHAAAGGGAGAAAGRRPGRRHRRGQLLW